jgi:hypothetical protein
MMFGLSLGSWSGVGFLFTQPDDFFQARFQAA